MKIMWLLLALVGVSFGLAYAFFSSDNAVALDETMRMTDVLTYKVISNGG